MTEPGQASNTDPASGWTLDGERVHVFPVRVYYEDTDAGGIVYYANYLKFAERARTEMLRLIGRQQFDMLREDGIGFTVRSCQADYLAPARLDDVLEIRSTVSEVQGASMRMSQRIWRGDRLLCDLRFRIAVMNRHGRPVRIPKDIRHGLEARIVPSGAKDSGSMPRSGGTPRDCHTSAVDSSADPI